MIDHYASSTNRILIERLNAPIVRQDKLSMVEIKRSILTYLF